MRQSINSLSVDQICQVFEKSRQAWYENIRKVDHRFHQELVLMWVEQIRIHLPRLGGVKLYRLLKNNLDMHRIKLGRDKFFRLLGEHGLLIHRTKRYARTTQSIHRYKKWPNLIKDMKIDWAEQVWVSDITYLRTESGFIYLFLITDAWSRKIMGYHLSQNLKAKNCITALMKAIKSRQYPMRSLIHHSDRGIQYCCDEYVRNLHDHHIEISMTQSGSPYDNAIAERINGILKYEFNLETVFKNYRTAIEPTARAISLYNNMRPHLSCQFNTPQQQHSNPNPIKLETVNQNQYESLTL